MEPKEINWDTLQAPDMTTSLLSSHDQESQIGPKNKKISVVQMLGESPDLPLPDDWIGVHHESGGIVYLHKKSRVVTWARPYYIGSGSLRKHKIPVAAIPCLHQILGLRAKNSKRKRTSSTECPLKKQKKVENAEKDRLVVKGSGNSANDSAKLSSCVDQSAAVDYGIPVRSKQQGGPVGIVAADSFAKSQSECNEGSNFNVEVETKERGPLTGQSEPKESIDELEPCKNVQNERNYEFQDAIIATKVVENIEVVDLEEMKIYLKRIFGFKEITEDELRVPVFGEGNKTEIKPGLPEALRAVPFATVARSKNQFTVSPGKTPLAILTEYCSKELKKKLEMVDVETEGEQYVIEAVIGGLRYGRGEGRSKKVARQVAAQRTMGIMMPEQFEEMTNFEFTEKQLSVFDKLDIDDPSVADFARSVGLPAPAEVLSTCLKRNRSLFGDADIEFKLTQGENSDIHTYEITCGKHNATGKCKNKRTGRHLGAQAILKKIHPKLQKWGQLVRMYCDAPKKFFRDSKKLESDREFSQLPRTNPDLILKLKEELRLLEKRSQQPSLTLAEGKSIATSSVPSRDLDL